MADPIIPSHGIERPWSPGDPHPLPIHREDLTPATPSGDIGWFGDYPTRAVSRPDYRVYHNLAELREALESRKVAIDIGPFVWVDRDAGDETDQ